MNKKAFTLIEIVLAISFLLIITVMVVPNMYTMIEKNNQKQLEKVETLIKDAAKNYINLDIATAEYIKTESPSPFYISLNDLKRMELISSQLKDPTQGNQEYDYTKVIIINYNSATGIYEYDLRNASDEIDPNLVEEKTLILKAFTSTYNNVWYSGLNWQVYKISNTVDGDPSNPNGANDYIHLKLTETSIGSTTIDCNWIENNLNNRKWLLVKRVSGTYCVQEIIEGNNTPRVVLKNNMLFIKGDGTNLNPFLLIGDFKGYQGQQIAKRNIGEYINYNNSTQRIMKITDNQIILANGETVSLFSKIIDGSGSSSDPYIIGGE